MEAIFLDQASELSQATGKNAKEAAAQIIYLHFIIFFFQNFMFV